jgi:mannosidase alpha-like ER degradation enhancer 2
MQQRVVAMFYHAYDNYMLHAFPHDELLPLSCHYVDNFGSYALTLIDSLDMLAVLGNRTEFTRAVGLLKEHLSFDSDTVISVFETNIRVMGGLLSAHLLALDPSLHLMPTYDGCLLEMALDLGKRLLPAFDTPTGLPYGSVNLRSGVQSGETTISSTACAGTLLLEFATLSRLSGNGEYERVAKRALVALWSRRSEMGLVGGHIDIVTGQWTHKDSGVGTSIDSYFEYLMKAHLMTGEHEYLVIFQQAYGAAKAYLSRQPW